MTSSAAAMMGGMMFNRQALNAARATILRLTAEVQKKDALIKKLQRELRMQSAKQARITQLEAMCAKAGVSMHSPPADADEAKRRCIREEEDEDDGADA
jgi:hypothetical protein